MTLDRLHSFVAKFHKPEPVTLGLSLNEGGFALHPAAQIENPVCFYNWGDLARIIVFKRDCLVYGLLCMVISDGKTMVEINEEQPAWNDFIREAEQNLKPIIPVGIWWAALVRPPFEADLATI